MPIKKDSEIVMLIQLKYERLRIKSEVEARCYLINTFGKKYIEVERYFLHIVTCR